MNQIATFFLFLAIGLFYSCDEQVKSAKKITEPNILAQSYLLYQDFPSNFIDPRNVEVWLPKNYSALDSLPVLYMFDGQNIFHGSQGWGGEYNNGWQVDEVLDSLFNVASTPEIMVVGIFNGKTKRMAEYMPAKPAALLKERIALTEHDWYKHLKTTAIESDEMLKFLVEELKPYIDSAFKTKKTKSDTYIAGSSMGGLISAYAICEYPEVFGGAACFSTHWPPLDGVFLEYLKYNLPDPNTHKIYFDFGTEGLDESYEPFQKIADQAMQAKGFEQNKNWITRKFEGEDHNEKYWHNRFHIPMEFLLTEQ